MFDVFRGSWGGKTCVSLNSFRLKIALLSGLITGLLLVGSGLVLWRVTYEFNLDRLDREIRNLGQANLERVQGGDHWTRLEDALKFVSGSRSSAAFVLWVKNYDKVIYQSPDWPANLAPESFPLPQPYEGPNAPRPGEPPPPPPRRGEEISPRNPPLPLKSPQFYTREAGGKSWRIGMMGNPYVTLILAADMGEFNERMAGLRNTYLAALSVVLVLVAGSGWLIARRALRPVTALTRTAERVTARGLDQRIPAMIGDREFNRLIIVFNEMLDRLETSFRQATRFSADASHELKTPLARLQIELEQALENAPSGSPQQEVYSSLLDEISRLKAIVQKLLLLSLADAGRLRLQLQPVDLSAMLANVVEDCRAQAPALNIEQQIPPGIRVNADPDLLEQALQNLASNAIKYNRDGGRVRFDLLPEADQVSVRIANTGPPIPPADRDRIFERFYRADPARSGRVEGSGLGLSLAREIIRAHGGDLCLETSDPQLTRFAVKLPAPLPSRMV
jgi:two-component system heavy metal sensor histidine kinase CusS